ncbi:MAG: hypothetical protein XXXJIFNMEKO3_00136 [Candidatus Erwinia impunctatus]
MIRSTSSPSSLSTVSWWKPVLFFAVVIIGLAYVKWQPYYLKAFIAADTHSIGKSILAVPEQSAWQSALGYAQVYFLAVWKAAVLGILLGSLVQVLIPRNWLLRTLGQPRLSGTLYGTLLSLPGMMCTCCAAPLAAGMKKSTASTGGMLAFWLGNPLLNPATLIFMGFVLRWQFTLIRAVAGVVMVVGIARLVQKWVPDTYPVDATGINRIAEDAVSQPFLQRWLRTMWSLFWNTVPVYLLAVLCLGAAQAWLFPQAEGVVSNNLFWVVVMAIAGMLFVIPTAAEIPIIKTMMLAGMGVSPALALLVTLPASSLPSLLMLRSVLPAKALWLSGGLVVLSGVLLGGLSLIVL